MNLLQTVSRMFSGGGGNERRANDATAAWFAGGVMPFNESASGITVTPEIAMRVPAVHAAVKIISESIAELPLFTYTRGANDERVKAKEHPLYNILHRKPNGWQTSFQFRELMQANVLKHGTAYAQIIRNNGGEVQALIPIDSTSVTPKLLSNGTLNYEVHGNEKRILPQSKIFHLAALSNDGVCGVSAIKQCAEAIAVLIALERHAAYYFRNYAQPGGVFENEGNMKAEAANEFLDSWQKAHTKDNSFRSALLPKGVTWKPISINNEHSQFIEARTFQLQEIARAFRIPLHLMQDLTKSSFNNIAVQGQEFVTYTLLAWARRWEQALARDLLTDTEQEKFYFEIELNALARGDQKTRYDSYAVARQNGFMSVNEIRKLENLNPIEGGDLYLSPMNMIDAAAADDGDDPTGAGGVPDARRANENQRNGNEMEYGTADYREAFGFLLIDKFEEFRKLEADNIRLLVRRKLNPDNEPDRVGFGEGVEEFYSRHAEKVKKEYRKLLKAYASNCGLSDERLDKFVERFSHQYAEDSVYRIQSNGDFSKLRNRCIWRMIYDELDRFDEFIEEHGHRQKPKSIPKRQGARAMARNNRNALAAKGLRGRRRNRAMAQP